MITEVLSPGERIQVRASVKHSILKKSTVPNAVLIAYGFNAKKDLPAELLALNRQVAAKIECGEPVTAPGIPPC